MSFGFLDYSQGIILIEGDILQYTGFYPLSGIRNPEQYRSCFLARLSIQIVPGISDRIIALLQTKTKVSNNSIIKSNLFVVVAVVVVAVVVVPPPHFEIP
jgi:hypothetical protein